MRVFGTLALMVGMVIGTLQSVQAAPVIPSFHELVVRANGAGARITESNFNPVAISNDSFWAANSRSAIKFKSEISGYNNGMGYANTDGSGGTVILHEGNRPGDWVSLAAAPTPFTFYLATNANNPQRGHHWYSDESLNVDGLVHVLTFQHVRDPSKFIMFWDDQRGGGDRDFNDFVARVNFVSQVPAPAALGLIALGLAGMDVARRRRK